MKIKKQHRKKKYLHKLNRKRMHRNQTKTGEVQCKVIKEAWDHRKTSFRNLREMGLSIDPNKTIKIPSFKQDQVEKAKTIIKGDDSDMEEEQVKTRKPRKVHVVQELEKESKAPRERKFMLPKGQVNFITYLMDKYGYDYKAMERDKKNYYQETWKQLRAKIKTFMGIPKQYGEYLKARNLIDKEEDEEEIKRQVKALVMED
ncbi:nucleolar protein 16 [Achroia grisella]|uniref:nucleolar protein 16 n=1 Tax=Achroia grisella TaxID=688607 RepID=UPI0027D26523|nr:nucleolar protein 16 [Achroia grisella]